MLSREIIIKAPIENVYKVISDFSSYPKFLKGTEAVKERKLKSGHMVDFKVNIMKEINYTLKMDLDPPNGLSWEFVEGDMMKKNSGSWALSPLDAHQTKAIYNIDISFGWLVPKPIVEQLTKAQLPEMLESFKKRAESL